MNSIKLTLHSPPFSLNSAYYKNRQRTKECRRWGNQVHEELCKESNQAAVKIFRSELHDKSQLEVKITYYYPYNKLYTKKGDISRRSMDLSNIEKLLVDLVFDPRFDGRVTTNGNIVATLNEDDKKIIRLISEKKLSETDNHYIEFSITNLNPL